MAISTSTGMLASRTPDRWGKRHHRQDRPHGQYRKLQKRSRRRAERTLWRTDNRDFI